MAEFSWDLLETRTVLLGVVVFLVVFRLLRRPRNLPPGPWGWPVLGNLPGLMASGKHMHVTFSKLAARYGDVVYVEMAGVPMVVVHGHNNVKEAFGMHQLSARPELHITTRELTGGIGVIASSGTEWLRLRRFSQNVLRGFGVGKSSFEQNISVEADILVEEMKKYEGEAFDTKHLFGNAVSNVICAVVFGKRFRYDDPAFQELLTTLAGSVGSGGAGAMLELLPIFTKLRMLPFVRFYVDATLQFHGYIQRLLGQHEHEADTNNPRDLIDAFLNEKKLSEAQGLDSPALRSGNLPRLVSDLFGAGTETTATTLRWAMLYMMAYPDVQARIQRELDSITTRNRFPRLADKPDLPYTEAVLSEIQRAQTIVPLAVPHLSSEDTTLLGFNIPKGTIVLSNLWHNHNDPSVWKDPETFRPERFLDEDGKYRPREEFTPFGIGRRICLGEKLAKMELFIFFTRLLHQFTIKKPDGAPSVSFEGISGVTWAPVKFEMCAVAREC